MRKLVLPKKLSIRDRKIARVATPRTILRFYEGAIVSPPLSFYAPKILVLAMKSTIVSGHYIKAEFTSH